MKIFVNFLALGGLLAVPALGKLQATASRELQTVEDLCIICDLCDTDIAADLCNVTAIADFVCDQCETIAGIGDDLLPEGICFSEVATVQVLQPDNTESAVQMKDLLVGDQVLTGMNQYQTVYAFGHHNPTRTAKFFQIYNDNSKTPLEITADHMVFLANHKDPVAAAQVQVGDVLHSSMGASKVTKISSVERAGIYAPLTTGGTLLVDGVLASSYISVGNKDSTISDHALIHMALSPYRMVCSGISSGLCGTDQYDEDGMPHYVRYGLGLLHWMNSSNVLVQVVVMAGIVLVTGAFWSLELLLGASWAPLMVFLATLAYSSHQKNNKSKSKAKEL